MKAVIKLSGQQYVVAKGDEVVVDRIDGGKNLQFEPLLIFDDKKAHVGQPTVKGGKVTAEVVEAESKGPKVKIVKFQAKKRVKKITGHRQPQSKIRIKTISVK